MDSWGWICERWRRDKLGGSRGMLSPKILESGMSETPFPQLSGWIWGKKGGSTEPIGPPLDLPQDSSKFNATMPQNQNLTNHLLDMYCLIFPLHNHPHQTLFLSLKMSPSLPGILAQEGGFQSHCYCQSPLLHLQLVPRHHGVQGGQRVSTTNLKLFCQSP